MKQLQYRAVRFQTRHIPRISATTRQNGTQVKDGNSPDNRIGGARYDMFIRRIGFRGNSDDFRLRKREHGDQHGANTAPKPLGIKPP